MRMDDMVEDLENRGFTAYKKYLSDEKCYLFTADKNGVRIQDKWKCPCTSDARLIDSSQREFLRNLVAKWNYRVSNEEYEQILLDHGLSKFSEVVKKRNDHLAAIATAQYALYCKEDVKNTMELKKIINSKFGVGSQPTIKNVHFNPPMTIVIWTDGTKTFVKAHNENFDPEKGLAMAIAKKFIGDNKYDYIEEVNKWVGKYKPDVSTLHHLGEYVARGFTDGIHDNDPELQELAKKQAEIHIEPSGSAILSGKSSWHISTSLYWDEAEFKCRNCGCKITTTKDKKAPDTCPICNCYMESKDSDS